MQKNIDFYYKKVTPAKKNTEAEKIPAPKKRKALVISSDEEEVVESPQPISKELKKARTENLKTPTKSDSSGSSKKPSLHKLKAQSKEELKRVDPLTLFGGETKRVEAKKAPKTKDAAIIELEDNDIDNNLIDINVDEAVSVKENIKSQVNGVEKKKDQEAKTPTKTAEESQKNKVLSDRKKKPVTPKTENKDAIQKKENTPKGRQQHMDSDNSVLSDEDRHERKRMAAILYQKYKNRSSCINPGSKEVPKGKPNCLAGLTFLVTGVLESLERDEAGSIIKEYGGKVMTTVGKRLNYLVMGEDAGPKKLAQAEEFGVKILSEDGLFDLIREKSGNAPTKKKVDNVSDKPSTSVKMKQELQEKIKKEQSVSPPKKKEKLLAIATEVKSNSSLSEVTKEKPLNIVSAVKSEISVDMMTWVDKYKPMNVKDIIGQHGAASNVVKLTNWLSKWYINHDGKKKLQRPNPWAKNDDGSYFKAALLSGPPGIGKTTTAMLVCKELGFDTVEFNASDTRSKKLLKEQVSELLSNKSLYGFFHGSAQALTKKHVLLMDEVDGMAGNEDRGGIQELIGLIKESSVPIICMCNDRNHQKMRSLVNYCYDLRFNRPRMEQIKGRMMSICYKEQIKIDGPKVEEIIAATNNDIRQSINHLFLLSAGKVLNLTANKSMAEEKIAQKDLKFGPWDVVRKVFSAEEHKHMNFNDKCDLFFHDYSLAPLFVQHNYLQVSPAGPKSEVLEKVALAADAISLGDLVDKRIRSNMAWSLLPTQAVFSSVMPGDYMCGHFTGQINFPGWLGKNSREKKRSRLAQEIHDHTRVRTSGSRLSARLDYAPFLLKNIVRPLVEKGMDGVQESLNVIKDYHLLREDIDSLIELTTWPGKKGPMDAVDGRVKAALTRAYNKEVLAYTYSAMAGAKGKKAEAASDDIDLLLEGEDEEAVVLNSDEEKDDNLENDALIKPKKKPAGGSAKPKPNAAGKKPAAKPRAPKAKK